MNKVLKLLIAPMLLATLAGASDIRHVAEKANALNREHAFQSVYTPFTVSVEKMPDLDKILPAYDLLSPSADLDAIIRDRKDYIKIIVPVKGAAASFLLYKEDIKPDDFQVITSNGEHASDGNIIHYRGVMENTDVAVAFSFSTNETMGLITAPEGNFILGRLSGESAYIIYNSRNLKVSNIFSCATDVSVPADYSQRFDPAESVQTTKCVRWYWETDYDLFTNKGSTSNVNTYMQGIFNQVSMLYANDGISIMLQTLYIWNTTDPYTGPSTSNYLTQFGSFRTSFNGDVANLIGLQGGGGIAWVNGLCNSQTQYKMAYSGISTSYNSVPAYSWTVEVITHEEGHVLGSRHTHDCVWNGNNTPIDGCGPAAGYSTSCTPGPLPSAGTIMSYCHLISGIGIDFNLGFGTQPKNLIINNVNNSACLSSCSGCTLPVQPAAISGATSACSGSATIYSVASVATATSYTWSLPSGWSGSSTTNSISVIPGTTGGIISVKANNSCGAGPERSLSVTVNASSPAQPGAISGSAMVCPGASLTYSVSPVINANNYLWTLPAGWTGSSTTNSINVIAGSSGGTISVSASNICGQSTPSSLNVNIGGSLPSTPSSISTSGGGGKVCPGDTRTYTTSAASGVTFNWTVPNGGMITSGQGTNSITVNYTANFTTSGTLSVVKVNSCGSSSPRSITVGYNLPATPGTMTGPAAGLCGTSGNIYSVPLVSGVIYHWTVPAGATITSGQNSNSITASFPQTNLSGTVSVYASNNCGNSAKRSKSVKTMPATPGPISGSTAICPNTSGISYSIAPVPSAVSYTWTGPTGSHITAGAVTSTGNTLTTTATGITASFTTVTTSSKMAVRANNACGSGSTKTLSLAPASCREEASEVLYGLFPNPSTGNVTLTINAPEQAECSIKLLDITGRIIYSREAEVQKGTNSYELELEQYNKGIYILQVFQGSERFSQKLELQ